MVSVAFDSLFHLVLLFLRLNFENGPVAIQSLSVEIWVLMPDVQFQILLSGFNRSKLVLSFCIPNNNIFYVILWLAKADFIFWRDEALLVKWSRVHRDCFEERPWLIEPFLFWAFFRCPIHFQSISFFHSDRWIFFKNLTVNKVLISGQIILEFSIISRLSELFENNLATPLWLSYLLGFIKLWLGEHVRHRPSSLPKLTLSVNKRRAVLDAWVLCLNTA